MDTLMTGKDFIARLDELLNERCMSVNDMCAEGDISREAFRTKKEQIESQLAQLEENNQACRNYIADAEGEEERLNRIASLDEFIKMKAFDPAAKIPESFMVKKTDDDTTYSAKYYSSIDKTANAFFLGTYQIPYDFALNSIHLNYGKHRRCRMVGDLVIKLYLV